ncbi:hypothetical protein GCM10023085_40560 [Actinomadura viridis]
MYPRHGPLYGQMCTEFGKRHRPVRDGTGRDGPDGPDRAGAAEPGSRAAPEGRADAPRAPPPVRGGTGRPGHGGTECLN